MHDNKKRMPEYLIRGQQSEIVGWIRDHVSLGRSVARRAGISKPTRFEDGSADRKIRVHERIRAKLCTPNVTKLIQDELYSLS